MEERPRTAFVLSLIGGVLMIVSGGMGIMTSLGPQHYESFWRLQFPIGLTIGLMSVGIIAGLIVTAASLTLYAYPSKGATWGTIILVFSIVGFAGTGGFFVGTALGVIGAARAFSWTPASDR